MERSRIEEIAKNINYVFDVNCLNTSVESLRFKVGDMVQLLPLEKILTHPSVSHIVYDLDGALEIGFLGRYSMTIKDITHLKGPFTISDIESYDLNYDDDDDDDTEEYYYEIDDAEITWLNDWMLQKYRPKADPSFAIKLAKRILN